MDAETAIRIDGVSKRFRIYATPGARLLQVFRKKKLYEEFTALDGVSFEIAKGETVGIVGRNGSGKSTLLQIICGTLAASAGEVRTNGRIVALLELGSGFNPEFSGRENVFLNASVLGLSPAQIDERFAAIEAFAEIGEFIDQPVKTYSSGMMVRLAFAVAANIDPQILVIDEALAVGDELFQRKCYARIEELKAQGATILFVSHASNTVVSLCDRAILLDGGKKLTEGLPKVVVGHYQKLLNAPREQAEALRQRLLAGQPEVDAQEAPSGQQAPHTEDEEDSLDPHLLSKSALAYDSRGARISDLALYNEDGRRVNCLKAGNTYRYGYNVHFERAASHVRFGMLVKTPTGVELGGATSARQLGDSIPFVAAGTVLAVEYRFHCRLNEGLYFLNAGVSGDCGEGFHHLHRVVDGLCFRVNPEPREFGLGAVDFACRPQWRRIE